MNQTTSEKHVAAHARQRKKGLTIFAAALLIAGAGSAYWYLNFGTGSESTDDAYVNGNLVQLTPEIAGTVTRIAADDGDYVTQGQELVRFDSSDADIAFDNAEASLAQAVRQVRAMFNNAEQARAVVAEQKIALRKAESDLARRKNMVKAGGLSQEELSHAQEMANSAEKALAVAEQQLKSQEALVRNTTVETHPLVKSAIGQLRQAYLAKQRTSLVAPVSGYVARRNVQVGQRMTPGATLMAVVPLDQVWVDANFKETQLKTMRIGQPATIIADLYGDKVEYHGKVESLGIGTGSAFSLLPAQNATGNWIKVVQRLPVRIQLDEKDLKEHPLRIGLSMMVDVDTQDTQGELLSRAAPAKPRYQTDVYTRQLDGIDSIVSQIIAANDTASSSLYAKQ
ncbi:efflux RND transporter periplasmic adaptor subunit [Tolumonas osonensis]|uniref:Membrane fusion protein (Multidrug efflux system) n=1 Tax=Tolumonas osonensis TaxID=675874 RepID=A0A841GI04_9GAMM|nr:efflux RND transporter periplasmic adaptor subunit [Tolumonas osonensis]MBB6054871.1 membrane fusion protein (multidrug efflux system) [Tolumonas osonensis]